MIYFPHDTGTRGAEPPGADATGVVAGGETPSAEMWRCRGARARLLALSRKLYFNELQISSDMQNSPKKTVNVFKIFANVR